MAATEFGHADRQIAIGLDALIENLHMRGTVHGLKRHEVALACQNRAFIFRIRNLVRHDKHVFAILAPMARLFPELRSHKLRRLHFGIIRRIETTADVSLKLIEDHITLGVPEHRALRLFLKMIEVHLTADLTVVALFSFLYHREVSFQLSVGRPDRAVDALEHFVAAVATPIGTGQLRQLEGLAKLACGRQMRTTAQVEPIALLVNRHVFGGRNALDNFGFVELADAFEIGHRIVARPDFTRDNFVAVYDLAHPLLDLLKVFRPERFLACEIVEEAVFNGGADGDLRARKQFLHRFGHDMRRVMAQQFESVRRCHRDDLNRHIAVDDSGKVFHLAVDLDGNGFLGQRFGDALGKGQTVERRFGFADRTIGQCQLYHFVSLKFS